MPFWTYLTGLRSLKSNKGDDYVTSSTLDLILVSDVDRISQSGVTDFGLSDHSLIFCTRKKIKTVFKKHNSVKLWSLNIRTGRTFKWMSNAYWSPVMSSGNVIDVCSRFISMLMTVVDNIAPIKVVRIERGLNPGLTMKYYTQSMSEIKLFEHLKGINLILLLLF